MDLTEFLQYIPKIKTEALPGESAHQKMIPPERISFMENINWAEFSPRKAAVMMLLYPKNNTTHLVLILRNSYKGIHSSQVGFPGGKVEAYDSSLEAAALRETYEEIGIPTEKMTVIRAFSEVYIPPSNFIVYPFLGYSTEVLSFIPDPREVSGIIEVSLQDFLHDSAVTTEIMATSYMKENPMPVFQFGEHTVWGATGMILSELKEVLKSVL